MRRLMVLNILLVLVLAVPVFVSADALPWAEYGRNAQNTGQSEYIGPTDTSRTWKVALDYNNRDSFTSPVVDGSGTVYLLDSGWSYVNGQWVERGVSEICSK